MHILFQESLNQGKLLRIWEKANIVSMCKEDSGRCQLSSPPVYKIVEKLPRRWIGHLEEVIC